MTNKHRAPTLTQIEGDALEQQKLLPSKTYQMCLTSPPYYGLRQYLFEGAVTLKPRSIEDKEKIIAELDKRKIKPKSRAKSKIASIYQADDIPVDFEDYFQPAPQLGLEPTPEEYIQKLVRTFRETYRILKDDGTLWVNIGDTYASTHSCGRRNAVGLAACDVGQRQNRRANKDIKDKDLLGIPWRLAFELQKPYYTGVFSEYERIWIAATIEATCTVMHTGIQRFHPNPKQEEFLRKKGQAALIQEVYPHLTTKKLRARLAYNHILLAGEGSEDTKLKWLKDRITDLNAGEHLTETLPKWVKEVPSLFEPGWFLRCDIIWHKTNPCPDGGRDRPTKAHEYIFLLSKKSKYKYNAEAIMEACSPNTHARLSKKREEEIIAARAAGNFAEGRGPVRGKASVGSFQVKNNAAFSASVCVRVDKRHKRSVWTMPSRKAKGMHFATFSPQLILPCILAGSDPGDTIIDIYSGSGTTGETGMDNGRDVVQIDLKPDYTDMSDNRNSNFTPGLKLDYTL